METDQSLSCVCAYYFYVWNCVTFYVIFDTSIHNLNKKPKVKISTKDRLKTR